MMNACILCASCSGEVDTPQETAEKIKQAASRFSGAFHSMENSVSKSTPENTVYHLSK